MGYPLYSKKNEKMKQLELVNVLVIFVCSYHRMQLYSTDGMVIAPSSDQFEQPSNVVGTYRIVFLPTVSSILIKSKGFNSRID